MYRKKAMALILTAAVCAGTLAGCGQGAGNGGNTDTPVTTPSSAAQESTQAPETQATEGVKGEPVKIEWLGYNCYGQPDKNSEVVKQIEEKFNVDFDFWYVDDQNWDEVLSTKLAGGEMPDVLRIKNSANIPNYVKQGILAEVTDEMKQMMPDYQKMIDEYDKDGTGMIDSMYEGKQYLLKTVSVGGSYPTVLTWRVDWLKKCGIDKIPSTLDEFEEAMYAFTNNDPDGDGKKNTFGLSNTALNAVFGAYGAIPLKEFRGTGTQNLFFTMVDGKVGFAAVQPEMKDALAKLAKWYADGVIDPEFITGENKSGYWAVSQDFENGKVGVTGMAMASHWMPPVKEGSTGGTVYESYMAVNPDAVWGETVDIGPAVTGPEGKSGTHCWGAFGSSGMGITTQCAEDEQKLKAVCALINAMCSDFDTFVLGRYGIEGKHYTIDDLGNYVKTEAYSGNAELNKDGIGIFTLITNPEFEKKTSAVLYEFSDKYKSTGYSDVLVPQTEAASMFMEDLKLYTLDTYIKIITGEESVDYFDKFVEEFYATGGQQILDEVNAAIEAK